MSVLSTFTLPTENVSVIRTGHSSPHFEYDVALTPNTVAQRWSVSARLAFSAVRAALVCQTVLPQADPSAHALTGRGRQRLSLDAKSFRITLPKNVGRI